MIPSILTTLLCLQSAAPIAQSPGQEAAVIEMSIARADGAVVGQTLRFEGPPRQAPDGSEVIASPGTANRATLPCGVTLEAVASGEPDRGYQVTVDTDGNSELEGEPSWNMKPGDRVNLTVTRQVHGKQVPLPFELRYRFGQRTDGSRYESISVYPLYHLEGDWVEGRERTLVRLYDFTADGAFDWRDLRQGTAFALDRNGDREIRGSGEWHNLGKIFVFRGRQWVLDREGFSSDDSMVTIYPAPVAVARLNKPAPEHEYITADGSRRRLDEYSGRIHIVNFWRTTCAPCVTKLSEFRALEAKNPGRLTVTYYSTDDLTRSERAFQIARERDLPERQLVVQGLGEEDPLWQSLGSMMGSMAVPVYVLIDSEGMVRHASRTLAEVRAALEQFTP